MMIKNKDFILLFIGRLMTNFGDSLYAIATALLIYRLANSIFYSGFALFLTSSMGIVQLLLSPLLDRINIKKTLIISQGIQAVLLLIIPILYQFNQLTVVRILLIMPIITLLNQFIYPSQVSLLPKILKEEELLKGNTLFMIAYQGSDAIFNALSGILITFIGSYAIYYISSVAFFINSMLFLFLSQVVAHANAQVTPRTITSSKNYQMDFVVAFTILKNQFIWPVLVGIILINFVATGIYANLPAFASSELSFSFFMATSGIGILLGSVLLNLSYFQKISLRITYTCSAVLIGISWILTGYSQGNIWLALLFFLLGWVPVGMINILSQTMLQMMVPRGRIGVVMGATLGLSTCLAPFGALVGGGLGSFFSSSIVLIMSGCLVALIGLFWFSCHSFNELGTLSHLKEKGIVLDGHSSK